MNLSITLPLPGSGNQANSSGPTSELTNYVLKAEPLPIVEPSVQFNRLAYAAPHIIIDPLADSSANSIVLDWEATMAFRHYLWSFGFGIAEAMDTSQRGMGLTWELAQELIARTIKEAQSLHPKPDLVCGVGTDQLAMDAEHRQADIIAAYLRQIEFVEKGGGACVLMASRALAQAARSADDYRAVYATLLRQVSSPVILHWLGEMFDPQLKNYWSGNTDLEQAMDCVLSIIAEHSAKVAGIKVSLLNAELEINLRNRLPSGVRLFTGDDFNYPQLIKGDASGYSHALLGVFSAIAPAASLGLSALARGNTKEYDRCMDSTLDLASALFAAPTQFYKAGIGFLAWLNHRQQHFIMPQGLQASRSIQHYAQLFYLADQAGLLEDPRGAVTRMQNLLALYGI